MRPSATNGGPFLPRPNCDIRLPNDAGVSSRIPGLLACCEDGSGLYEPAEQAGRLAAARAAARGIPFWINARTDMFLAGTDDAVADGIAYGALNAAVTARLPC